jgi:hypothetical protein
MGQMVALLLAAAVKTLVPRRRLVGVLSGHGRYGGSVAVSAVLAYWLGNPTLNPAECDSHPVRAMPGLGCQQRSRIFRLS